MRGWRPGRGVPWKSWWWDQKPALKALEAELLQARAEHSACAMLLREADHRAKNSLQLAAAMLRVQSRGGDLACREALIGAADRLSALAELHRVRSDAGEALLLIGEVMQPIAAAYQGLRGARVHVEGGRFACRSEEANTLVLIVNEALANAVKHYSGSDVPVIVVDLREDGNQAWLSISDNGDGFGDGPQDGFGLRLLRLLARQLGGALEVTDTPGGACLSICYPHRDDPAPPHPLPPEPTPAAHHISL